MGASQQFRLGLAIGMLMVGVGLVISVFLAVTSGRAPLPSYLPLIILGAGAAVSLAGAHLLISIVNPTREV